MLLQLFYDKEVTRLLHSINKKVDILMSQVDDLKSAVADEISDVQAILAKLQANPVVQDNPDIAQAITQLQQSHKDVQAVLNKPVV